LGLGFIDHKGLEVFHLDSLVLGLLFALFRRQASEQYFTVSQFFAQALRQTMGLPQAAQAFAGRKLLLPLNGVGMVTAIMLPPPGHVPNEWCGCKALPQVLANGWQSPEYGFV
jgi:hypothetical protein